MNLGPQQKSALQYIREHPGCTKYEVAKVLRRRRDSDAGIGYAYQTLDRLLARGLVENRPLERGTSRLFVVRDA